MYLPLRHGRIVGLALHELATNAAKYGALSSPEGTVTLAWHEEDTAGQKRLHLDWRESGGPMVGTPEQMGFGSRLLERIVTLETDGTAEMRFEATGLQYQLSLPLE